MSEQRTDWFPVAERTGEFPAVGSGATGPLPPAVPYRRRVNTPLAFAVLWLGLAIVPFVLLDSWTGRLNPNYGSAFGYGTDTAWLRLDAFPAARAGVALLSVTPFFVAAQVGARNVAGRLLIFPAVVIAAVCYFLVPFRNVSGSWWLPAVADVVLYTTWLVARARSWPAYLTVVLAAGVAVLWNGTWEVSRELRVVWGHLPHTSLVLTLWWTYLAEFVALGVVGLFASAIGQGRRAKDARVWAARPAGY